MANLFLVYDNFSKKNMKNTYMEYCFQKRNGQKKKKKKKKT